MMSFFSSYKFHSSCRSMRQIEARKKIDDFLIEIKKENMALKLTTDWYEFSGFDNNPIIALNSLYSPITNSVESRMNRKWISESLSWMNGCILVALSCREKQRDLNHLTHKRFCIVNMWSTSGHFIYINMNLLLILVTLSCETASAVWANWAKKAHPRAVMSYIISYFILWSSHDIALGNRNWLPWAIYYSPSESEFNELGQFEEFFHICSPTPPSDTSNKIIIKHEQWNCVWSVESGFIDLNLIAKKREREK